MVNFTLRGREEWGKKNCWKRKRIFLVLTLRNMPPHPEGDNFYKRNLEDLFLFRGYTFLLLVGVVGSYKARNIARFPKK